MQSSNNAMKMDMDPPKEGRQQVFGVQSALDAQRKANAKAAMLQALGAGVRGDWKHCHELNQRYHQLTGDVS